MKNLAVNNNTIIVNGASSGIGKALSIELARRNFIVIAVARSKDKLLLLKNNNKKIQVFPADLSIDLERKKLYRWILKNDLNIISIVNSIGSVTPIKSALNLKISEWKNLHSINFEAPLFTSILLSNLMKKGRILFVGSSSSSKPRMGWTPYCTSKSALKMATECLKLEWGKSLIKVSSAKPGAVYTKIMKQGMFADENIFPDKKIFEKLKKDEGFLLQRQWQNF